MKKLFLILILILVSITPVFSAVDSIEDFIIQIENGDFSSSDLEQFQNNMSQSPHDRALELFLRARLTLDNYAYLDAYQLLQEASELANTTNTPRLVSEIEYYIMTLDLYFGNLTHALTHAQTLRDLATENNYPKLLIEADYLIAYAYLYYYDYDQGMTIAEELLKISNDLNYEKGLSYFDNLTAIMFDYNGDEDQALEYYQKALERTDPLEFDVVSDSTFNLQASIIDQYFELDDYVSMKNHLDHLGDFTSNLSKYDQSYYYTFLGMYYYYSSDSTLEEAAEYFTLALDLYYEVELIENAYPYDAYLLQTLGEIHTALGNFELSSGYFQDSLYVDYGETDEDIEQTLQSLDNIKLNELNSKMALLEELNTVNEEKVLLARRFIIGMTISIVVLLIAAVIILIEIKSKRETQKVLYRNSITDSLTQIYNRGKIIDIFSNNLDEKNAVILLDLDNFKDINDTYGHVAGDYVLVEIANIIKDSIRDTDQLGRYGGEEFLVFLENTPKSELINIGERIRLNIEAHSWPYESLKTTASIGLTNCFSTDPDEVLHEADTLMYSAKNNGKNQIAFI
jgi:diguanylate cyclase (GGDEF)-like protein